MHVKGSRRKDRIVRPIIVGLILFCLATVCFASDVEQPTGINFSHDERKWIAEAKNRKILIGIVDSETPLYYFYGAEEASGYIPEIAGRLQATTGLAVSVVPFKDTRALVQSLNRHEIDAIFYGDIEETGNTAVSKTSVPITYSLYTNHNVRYHTDALVGQKVVLPYMDESFTKTFMKEAHQLEPLIIYNMDRLSYLSKHDLVDLFFLPDVYFEHYVNTLGLKKLDITDTFHSTYRFTGNPNVVSIIDKLDAQYNFHQHLVEQTRIFNCAEKGLSADTTHYFESGPNPHGITLGFYNLYPFQFQMGDAYHGITTKIVDEIQNKYGIPFTYVYPKQPAEGIQGTDIEGNFALLRQMFLNGEIDCLPYIEAEFMDEFRGENKEDADAALGAYDRYEVYKSPLILYGTDKSRPLPSFQQTPKSSKNHIRIGIDENVAYFLKTGALKQDPNIEYVQYDMAPQLRDGLVKGKIDYVIAAEGYNHFSFTQLKQYAVIGTMSYAYCINNRNPAITEFFHVFFGYAGDYNYYNAVVAYDEYINYGLYFYHLNDAYAENEYAAKRFFGLLTIFVVVLVAIVALVRNIQFLKRSEHLKYTDFLTGLDNRYAFTKKVDQIIQKKNPFYLVILDIDYFKHINDTYGHKIGDEAIKHVGQVLQSCCLPTVKKDRQHRPTHNCVSRIGGDEFMFTVLGDDLDTVVGTLEAVQKKAGQFVSSDGTIAFAITLSMGACPYKKENESFDALYVEADKALYASKENGRNMYTIQGE